MPNTNKRIAQRRVAEEQFDKLRMAQELTVATKAGRAANGVFLPHNEYALKYPLKVTEDIFKRMYEKLISDEATGEPNVDNPTRANTIKLVGEVALCAGITYMIYKRLKGIYCQKTDSIGNPNPLFSESVLTLSNKIEEICEFRLAYSGQFMDIFLLKNHYGYVDKKEVNLTLGVETRTFFTLPDGTKLPI